MDLSWMLITFGAIYISGYLLYTTSEKRIKALEKRVRQVEEQLKQTRRGEEQVEPEVNNELRELLRKGKMVEAVKRTREEFGWSLVEAKQYVDALKAKSLI